MRRLYQCAAVAALLLGVAPFAAEAQQTVPLGNGLYVGVEAGAIVLPAIPSFYSGPKNANQIADTVVWRILDQLGLPSPQAFRWQSQQAGRRRI